MRRRKLDKAEVVAKFKQDAKRRPVMGHDFLAVAAVGDADLCPYLQSLKATNGWRDDDDAPWGRLVTVLCEWFKNRSDGLVQLSRGANGRPYIGMCLAVLANERSSENLVVMARIMPLRFRLPTDSRECEVVSDWCFTIVQFLHGGRPIDIPPATENRLREFAHLFLQKAVRAVQKREKRTPGYKRRHPSAGDVFYFGPGLALLAHVGNEESIELIRGLPQSSTGVKGEEVIQKIESRIRNCAANTA